MIQSSSLTPQTLIVASPTAVMAELAGEVIVLDTTSGIYYGLKNEVSTRIWQLIQQPISISSIGDALLSEYDVDPERCQRDVLELIQAILDQNLAETCDEKAL
jgi:hypothetical protein